MKYVFALCISILNFTAAADSDRAADLQYSICDEPHIVRDALELKKGDSDERAVYLFETAKLDLFDHGLQIRLRMTDKKSRISIKRFDLSETEFLREQSQKDVKCEMDVHGKGQNHVLSCSIDSKVATDDTKRLIAGEIGLADVFDDAQQTFLKSAAIDMARLKLKALGPIQSRTWDFQALGIDDDVVLEQQTLPDGTRYLEFSVKTKASKLSQEINAAEQLFNKKGLSLCSDQTGQREGKLRALLNSAK